MAFDLLSTVVYGGCSAKLPAEKLSEALSGLIKSSHKNLLVSIETHDDAGVYKINDETALIQTLDFFPPVCSDPYLFGQIAAANALSDVYAMGGTPLTAMNIVLFPSKSIPLEVLRDILEGGQDKVQEAGAVIVGGHTIEDTTPKYGLSVTGVVNPSRIITNSCALPGDKLILTKQIGTAIIAAAHRIGQIDETTYTTTLASMKLLNDNGAKLMQRFGVRSATDITGFGLLGHALKLAMGSKVSMAIDHQKVPLFNGVYELVEMGCIPGACFRNQEYVTGKGCTFNNSLDYNFKMLLLDAQTSGGLLISCKEEVTDNLLRELKCFYPFASVIGEVLPEQQYPLYVN